MKIGAVISEFNPFHNGHEYIINEFRRRVEDDTCVIALMSGDFVQRGEPAILPKEVRARAAAESCADLVIELPLPYCLSSAEGFASYAVNLLNGIGAVDYLFFGSESGNTEKLSYVAETFLKEEFTKKTLERMRSGISFPAAREEVLKSEGIIEKDSGLKPNDILAAEYIKAIKKSGSEIKPCAIRRVGAEHDAPLSSEGFASASHIRGLMYKGADAKSFLPEKIHRIYCDAIIEGRGPVSLKALEPMLLSRLRFLKPADFALLPDAAEGIENLLCKNINRESGLDEIIERSVSRRYPRSRIKRMLMCAALGISKEDLKLFERPPYVRVLALNGKGSSLLRQISEQSAVPELIKPSSVKRLGEYAEAFFTLSSRARDFYTLGLKNEELRIPGGEYRISPFVKKI